MCASYWNLRATVTCPTCATSQLDNLNTHFNGGGAGGMCTDYYELNQAIPPLGDLSGTMGSMKEGFNGWCKKCKHGFDVDAELVNGKIIRVWAKEK
jgi:hypothetical protein